MPNTVAEAFGSKKKPGKNLAAALAPAEPDPLVDVSYTGDLETDAAAELTALQGAFHNRNTLEDTRKRLATDSEYWVAVCFASRADKEAFLHASGLIQLGDKYLDGSKVAEILNIKEKP